MTQPKSYHVTCLNQIGIPDPFPLETKKFEIPIESGELVYPNQRYDKPCSPTQMYIPSGRVMFQLMRAISYAKNPDDLWFKNNGLIVLDPLEIETKKECKHTKKQNEKKDKKKNNGNKS